MENPHEERQSLLLERIIKNVDLLNDALLELDRSVAEINAHNQDITIAAELWEGVSVVWAGRALWPGTRVVGGGGQRGTLSVGRPSGHAAPACLGAGTRWATCNPSAR
jgi:hypothetical protein